jgi:hypothetical protein
MTIEHIPEKVVHGQRLGRHVHHDERSKSYRVNALARADLNSIRHGRYIPVLFQGDLGSCTGNAALGAVGTSPLWEALPDSLKPSTTDPDADERLAVQLYSVATGLDQWPGSWPPSDTGSDGLSVAKAAQKAGYISGYRHAFGLDDALSALANSPVIVGINWYSSFDEPDANGNIRLTRGAFVRGGHEIVMDELDVEGRRVGFTNSWGEDWGLHGRAYLSWDDFGRLLDEKGDVTVFVPLSAPEPQPVPNPSDPMAALKALLAELLALVQKILALLN